MNASSSRYVSRRPGIFTWAIAAIALQGLLTLSGCGDDDNATTPALRSLQITPANPSLAAGTSVQLAATATYSDGSQADVTTQVAWTSSNTAVASLGAATGKALAVSVGSSVVTAMMGGVTSAPITLTVTPATLVSLVVTPPSPSIALGMQQQFTATGTYTDNSTQNLTSQVTWRSTAATVATISNAAGSNGLARSISAGTSLVTATMASIASPPITVTVTAATLVAIQVQAVRPKIPLGTTRQLTATGTYTDNTTQDLTTLATWMSADSSIVSISNASGSQGRATGVAQGTTTVGATLGPVSSPPVSLTTTVARYAYVASFDAVYQYSIDARGALSPMTPAKVAAGAAPYSVAVDPTGRYAYVANLDDGTVSQYIIGAGGSLSPMTPATVATAGTGSNFVTVDPSGRYAYVTGSQTNTVSQYTLGADGTLTPMTPATVSTGPRPSCVSIDPSGRYAYVTNATDGTVSQYTIGTGGALSPMTPATVGAGPPASTPNSVTVDPNGRYAYVAELNSGSVSQYTIGAGGALSLIPPAVLPAGVSPSSVTVDPTGRYAYVANQGGRVTQFTIGPGGALRPMAPATVTAGTTPVYVTVDPTGRYAYVANSGQNSVSQYTIGAGGALSPLATPMLGTGVTPSSVVTTD